MVNVGKYTIDIHRWMVRDMNRKKHGSCVEPHYGRYQYKYMSMVEPYRNMHIATLLYCTQPKVSPSKISSPNELKLLNNRIMVLMMIMIMMIMIHDGGDDDDDDAGVQILTTSWDTW